MPGANIPIETLVTPESDQGIWDRMKNSKAGRVLAGVALISSVTAIESTPLAEQLSAVPGIEHTEASAAIVPQCDTVFVKNDFDPIEGWFDSEDQLDAMFANPTNNIGWQIHVDNFRIHTVRFFHAPLSGVSGLLGRDSTEFPYDTDGTLHVKMENATGQITHDKIVEKPEECNYPFSDVSLTSYARADILQIFEQSITTGTSETTYSPGDNVTRGQMAAFLARLYAHETGVSINYDAIDDHGFQDVPEGTFYSNPVKWLRSTGITEGKSSISYAPNDFINRGEMAAMLARFVKQVEFGVEIEVTGGLAQFNDIPEGVFYEGDVAVIFELGITNGTSETTFSPDDPVTREQMAAFVARTERII
jgi:hypothetical protein